MEMNLEVDRWYPPRNAGAKVKNRLGGGKKECTAFRWLGSQRLQHRWPNNRGAQGVKNGKGQ